MVYLRRCKAANSLSIVFDSSLVGHVKIGFYILFYKMLIAAVYYCLYFIHMHY